MTSNPIVARLWAAYQRRRQPTGLTYQPALHQLAHHPARQPAFVRESAVAQRYIQLLGQLDWQCFPERDLSTDWGVPTVPFAPFVAAYLVQLDQHFQHMSQLRQYLVDHPALLWALGFPLVPAPHLPWGFDPDASLPTQRHFSRILHKIPNPSLQVLLDVTVRLLQLNLATVAPDFGQAISLDTKHILAWVKHNNPKAYVKDRYDKHQQPIGDADCRLGCKRKRNQRASSAAPPPTPYDNPVPANTIAVGEYYWGYASGVVATKVHDWGEFVLAELTLPFDQPDVAYFFPLLADTERRLGFRPKFGALDAAYDTFYVYAYFQRAEHSWQHAFAAVPLAQRNSTAHFDANGLPLCKAQLAMPLKHTFFSKTAFVPHERGRYVCPLQFPEYTADACPINDPHWAKGGCHTTIPTSIGARLRHCIDRDSQLYQGIYKQRTATERINSQATALGIERPHLRNGKAIANRNTLIYILINLRALLRIQRQLAARANSQTQ